MKKYKVINIFDNKINSVINDFIFNNNYYTVVSNLSQNENDNQLIITNYDWYTLHSKDYNCCDLIVILPQYDSAIITSLIKDSCVYGYLIDDEVLKINCRALLTKHFNEIGDGDGNNVVNFFLERKYDNNIYIITDSNFSILKSNTYYTKKFNKNNVKNKNVINKDLNSSYLINTIINDIYLDKPWFGIIKEFGSNGKVVSLAMTFIPVKRKWKQNIVLIHGHIQSSLDQKNSNHPNASFKDLNIPALEFSFTPSGKIIQFEYFTDNFIGYEKKELIQNENFYDLLSSDKEKTSNYIRKEFQTKHSVLLELELVNNKGIIIPSLCFFYKQNSDGKNIFNGMVFNMFYYKESEARFNKIINNINEYIYSVKFENGEAVSTYHSPKCIDITGYTPLNYMNDSDLWKKMIYFEDKDKVNDFFSNIANSEKAFKIEHRIIKKDGSLRWILNTCSSTFQNGELINQDGIILDITERKMMEETLKNNEQRFRTLLENGSDIIALLSLNAHILYISSSVKKNLGYDPATIEGTLYLELIHPEDKFLFYQSMSKLMTDHDSQFTIKYRIKDFSNNYKTYETKGTVVKDNLDSIVLNSRDVTELDILISKLNELALYDELTGVYNRRGFKTLALQQIKISNRTMKKLFLFFIDMDNMKIINDKYGHELGDKALIKTKDILNATFRDSDIVSRFGGDEFVALVLESSDDTETSLSSRLTDITNKMNAETELPYKIQLSFGVSIYDPRFPTSYEELLRKADEAMYHIKQKKKIR